MITGSPLLAPDDYFCKALAWLADMASSHLNYVIFMGTSISSWHASKCNGNNVKSEKDMKDSKRNTSNVPDRSILRANRSLTHLQLAAPYRRR